MKRPEAKGKVVEVRAVNPESVCHPQALLASALLSVGVRQHPYFPFEILIHDKTLVWKWTFRGQSADGLYVTGELVKWWNDEAWLSAHPQHEWTMLRAGLLNMAAVAKGIRDSHPRIVIQRGNRRVHIPTNATHGRRQHLLGVVEGRIPISEPFAA